MKKQRNIFQTKEKTPETDLNKSDLPDKVLRDLPNKEFKDIKILLSYKDSHQHQVYNVETKCECH